MSKLLKTYNSSTGDIKKTARKIGAKDAFRNGCDIMLVKAYHAIVEKKEYLPIWEEDTFTTNFYKILEEICLDDDVAYRPHYQEYQITDEILKGNTRPQKAKRVDLVFATFYKPRLKYSIEAKILAQKNTETRNAKKLSSEYVVSGIDRFIKKDYDSDGCMVGYIINGEADSVLEMINEVLTISGRQRENLASKHTIGNYNFCYSSFHEEFSLKHFLFHFS